MPQAFYRRYRPSTFSDVLGQETIVRILKEAARRGAFSHAYLFAGPRGSGKTTTARLIAKAANCTALMDGEPCNECPSCKEMNEGRNLDVIEIDAASNRGIDEIRNLKENVRSAPSRARFKVFIIDEVHMLTTPAFNALLKTLEEPPEQVILILATTEFEKIPPTITSRTQQFHFKRVPLKVLTEKLMRIAETEKVRIEPEALELVASAAEGSFREAESLLDQLSTAYTDGISTERVERMVGKVGFGTLNECARYLLAGDTDAALALISEVADLGHHLPQFTKDLIQFLRRVAVVSVSPKMGEKLAKELTDTHLAALREHAKHFLMTEHLQLLKGLIDAYAQMRYSQFAIIPLEIAVIEGLRK